MRMHVFRLAAVSLLCVTAGCGLAGPKAPAPGAPGEARAEKVLRELGIEMVLVTGGAYTMGVQAVDGVPSEMPAHEVTVSDFLIGKTEVTQAQWETLMGSNPSSFKGPDRPVERVSWDDCQEFLRRLGEKAGRPFRLPTEAEWEYAARSGGGPDRWAGTSDETELGAFAWFADNCDQTRPVGRKKPNRLGIHDMSGNVWEWCSDWRESDPLDASPAVDPRGPPSGVNKMMRGGCWVDGPGYLLNTSRFSTEPANVYDRLGFRLAADHVIRKR